MKKYDITILENMILNDKYSLTEQGVPLTDTTQSNKFRSWFIKTYPTKAMELNLDPAGPKDNATMQQAWNYKPNDLDTTTAGQEFSNLSSRAGGLDSGIADLGISGWDVLFVVAGAVGVVFGIRSIVKSIKKLGKITKLLPEYLKTKGSGKRLLRFLQSDRNIDQLKRNIDDALELKAKEKQALKDALDDPGMVTGIKRLISKEYAKKLRSGQMTADEFIIETGINPKGPTAREAKKIERLQKKYGKFWKQAYKKQKQGIKSDVPKRQWTSVPSNPSIKFSEDAGWYLYKSASTESAKINNAVNQSIKNSVSDISLKEKIALMNASESRLTNKLRAGNARMSKRYLGLNEYPSFQRYSSDLRNAGVTDKIDMKRYITAQALWRLAKGL